MDDNYILAVPCKENDGVVIRKVRPMVLSPENVKRFWEESNKFRTLYNEELRGDFKKFIELFVSYGPEGIQSNGLFWVVDDFIGVFYLTHIEPGVKAKVHYTFFDRKHFGRVPLVREMLKFVFNKYQFVRVSAEVPAYAGSLVSNFVESVGFYREGKLRNAALYKDAWFDVKLYGILREETEKWA